MTLKFSAKFSLFLFSLFVGLLYSFFPPNIASAQGPIDVTATIKYYDSKANALKPARQVWVELWDRSFTPGNPDTKLATAATNMDGYVAFNNLSVVDPNDEGNGLDLEIVVNSKINNAPQYS